MCHVRLRMGVAEHAPLRFKRSLERSLRLVKLGLVREGRGQIVRTIQRLGMLLAEHPPPHAKHLPVDLQVKVRSTGQKQFRRPKFAIRCAKNPGKRCRVTGAMPPMFQRCEVRF